MFNFLKRQDLEKKASALENENNALKEKYIILQK